MPPNEKPRTSHVFNFSAPRKARACMDMPAMVVGPEPLDRPRPAFSNRITSRSIASGSVTAGSQLSSVPVKCCRHSSGSCDPEPKRRYAYRSPPAWRNWVGAVLVFGVFLLDMCYALLSSYCTGLRIRDAALRFAALSTVIASQEWL